MSDCSTQAWRHRSKPKWSGVNWHEPMQSPKPDRRGGIHGRVVWHDGTECELHYARVVNGEERAADRIELDGMTFKPERTCTMTRAYVGEPCSDFTCSDCGKMQCVPNGMHRLVPSVHCQRCGARVTRLVDQDGNDLPMHDG